MRVVRRNYLERLMHFRMDSISRAMSARGILADELPIREIAIPCADRASRSKLHVIKDGLRFLGVILRWRSCIVHCAGAALIGNWTLSVRYQSQQP